MKENIKIIGDIENNEIEINNTEFYLTKQVINEPELLKNSDMIFIISDDYENIREISQIIKKLDIVTVLITNIKELNDLKPYVTSIIPIKNAEKPLGYIKLIIELFKNDKDKIINLDFEDIANFFQKSKIVEITRGSSNGQNGTVNATFEALEKINILGAKYAIVYIIGMLNLTLIDIDKAVSTVIEAANNDVNVMFCSKYNQDLSDEVIIVILANKD